MEYTHDKNNEIPDAFHPAAGLQFFKRRFFAGQKT